MDRLLDLTTILSIILMIWVLGSVRRRHIRVEYSVSWLIASFVLLALSRWRSGLAWFAEVAGVQDGPLALLLLAAFVFLAVFYRFSLIISEMKDSNIALTQRVAILEFQLNSRERETEAVREGR